MKLGTLTELAETVGGTWAGGPYPFPARQNSFSGVSIDTRTLAPGDVFFCLKGDRTDGHAYAAAAARARAAAIIVRRKKPGFSKPLHGVPVLRVDDPLEALCDWAEAYRRRFEIRFAAVTGSAGKTTTKEMLASVLGRKYSTFKTPGNFNNLLGIPLALQRLRRTHRFGVVEMGMSSPGEIARLAEIIQPEVGVVTWIGPAHLEFFTSLSAIARAKRELFDYMPEDGIGVVNIDNPILARWKKSLKRKIIGYSVERKADFYATDIRLAPGETIFRLNGKTLIRLPMMGRHAVANALAACAVAKLYNIGVEKIQQGLRKVRLPAGRLVIVKAGSFTILDDTYNSNPISAKAAIDTLCALRPPGRKIACMGEMRELGVTARHLHKDVGRAAAERGVDILLGVGYWGRQIVAGAQQARRTIETHVVADVGQAAEWLKRVLEPRDVVLVKASRAIGFERIVTELTARRTRAKR
jgi:UDP-N-acetylmuramoyl-tripeptide--D-alanyl-D-alanine ligase